MLTETLRPMGVGDATEIPSADPDVVHWQNVDEAEADDGATTVYGEPVDWVRDLYAVENSGVGAGTISKIVVYARWNGGTNSPEQNSTRICIKSGATEVNGTEYMEVGFSFITRSEEWATDPDTGEAWTWEAIDALQIGASIRRPKVGAGPNVTQVYVVVHLMAVTTDPASSIDPASATLNGTLDDDGGEACDCGFEWGETVAYGNTTPTQSRTTGQTFAQTITGLDPVTTYHFRAFATNPRGTIYGADESFTTAEAKILRPNAVGSYYGLNPKLVTNWERVVVDDGDAWYVSRYGGTIGWDHDAYNLFGLFSGSAVITNVRVVARVRRIAQNPDGTYPTSIGLGVRIGGSNHYSNSNYSSNSYGTVTRDYATNPSTGVAWTVSDINSLQAYLRLYFINMALEQGGYISARCTQVYVEVEGQFLPIVQTDPASSIEPISAMLNGTLDDDGGEACDCGFEYGETETYGTTTPTQSKVTDESFSQVIGGLSPGTTYHFRAFATNAAGISYGADQVFTPLMALPTIITDSATALSAIAATLNGILDNDGGEACECGFEWGLDTGYGTTTPPQSKTTGETFSEVIRGLLPNPVYHFRAFATNSFVTGYGAAKQFTTSLVISRAYPLAREEL